MKFYQVTFEHQGIETFEIVPVNLHQNIYHQIRTFIIENILRYKNEDEFLREGKHSNFFEWNVSHIQEEVRCSGCLYNSLGQMDHMEHPYGCLHDPAYCEEC